LPEGVDLEVGAALGIPALTAYHAVAFGSGVAGKTVLVAGGAGAVGHYAVQMAKLAGARRIIATVSSAEKGELARAAGADLVLNYREGDLGRLVMEATDGHGVDRIIEVDMAANAATDFGMIAVGGEIVVYGSGEPQMQIPFGPAILKNVVVAFFIVYNLSAADRKRAVDGITALLEAGALQHNIAVRLPLERIVEGHELVETGRAGGNVVLDCAGNGPGQRDRG
jgi:NADPH2:quinone reductase